MRHARRRIVRRGIRLSAVGGILLGGLMVTQAMATEPAGGTPSSGSHATGSVESAAARGAGLVSRLGTGRTAGTWIGADGRPVVAVTDRDAAGTVRAAGARAKVVRHSMDELRSATKSLRAAPRVAGTAWSVDYLTNEVVVRADPTVSAGDWSRLTRLADGMGGRVRMERTKTKFTTRLNGAQPMFSTGGRCSAGYNVTDGQSRFILTAGHCGPKGAVWFGDDGGATELGQTVSSRFPGNDFSLIRYDNGQSAGADANVVAIGDGKGVRIASAGDAAVGQRVFRSGSTSGLHDGTVTGLDATVNYPEGTVTGLIETDVCAEPGDSGGPLFSDGLALGVTSGGSGDCTSGGTTFFQPLRAAMSASGVRLAGDGSGGTPSSAAAGAAQPSASASQGAMVAPGSAKPGAVEQVGSEAARSFAARLTDPGTVGPGLLVVAGSMVLWVAARYIRSERDREAYRRQYARTWS
ncbi:streptogrisin D [Streptomyces sp. B3I7]|uniref:S1 family peptidase n=1 Tax=Streptomyces sp. B3I7 TaxID=3042269 RepID=UPI00277E3A24|nr:S1 family peptidase [Streptomyces sp. B3I7]MDQ0809265.1 streptogrisin D [Streptomyces sp. B3I7]